jgi:hypothetical protein
VGDLEHKTLHLHVRVELLPNLALQGIGVRLTGA